MSTTGYADVATLVFAPPTTPRNSVVVMPFGITGTSTLPKSLKPMSMVVDFLIFRGRPILFSP